MLQRAEANRRRAEAAAVLDNNCAGCQQQYGDDPSKTDLWVACDACDRWFHAGCEGYGPEQAEDLASAKKYVCRACTAARTARRQSISRSRQLRARGGRSGGYDAGLPAEYQQQQGQGQMDGGEESAGGGGVVGRRRRGQSRGQEWERGGIDSEVAGGVNRNAEDSEGECERVCVCACRDRVKQCGRDRVTRFTVGSRGER